jgi:hypothetical protein
MLSRLFERSDIETQRHLDLQSHCLFTRTYDYMPFLEDICSFASQVRYLENSWHTAHELAMTSGHPLSGSHHDQDHDTKRNQNQCQQLISFLRLLIHTA